MDIVVANAAPISVLISGLLGAACTTWYAKHDLLAHRPNITSTVPHVASSGSNSGDCTDVNQLLEQISIDPTTTLDAPAITITETKTQSVVNHITQSATPFPNFRDVYINDANKWALDFGECREYLVAHRQGIIIVILTIVSLAEFLWILYPNIFKPKRTNLNGRNADDASNNQQNPGNDDNTQHLCTSSTLDNTRIQSALHDPAEPQGLVDGDSTPTISAPLNRSGRGSHPSQPKDTEGAQQAKAITDDVAEAINQLTETFRRQSNVVSSMQKTMVAEFTDLGSKFDGVSSCVEAVESALQSNPQATSDTHDQGGSASESIVTNVSDLLQRVKDLKSIATEQSSGLVRLEKKLDHTTEFTTELAKRHKRDHEDFARGKKAVDRTFAKHRLMITEGTAAFNQTMKEHDTRLGMHESAFQAYEYWQVDANQVLTNHAGVINGLSDNQAKHGEKIKTLESIVSTDGHRGSQPGQYRNWNPYGAVGQQMNYNGAPSNAGTQGHFDHAAAGHTGLSGSSQPHGPRHSQSTPWHDASQYPSRTREGPPPGFSSSAPQTFPNQYVPPYTHPSSGSSVPQHSTDTSTQPTQGLWSSENQDCTFPSGSSAPNVGFSQQIPKSSVLYDGQPASQLSEPQQPSPSSMPPPNQPGSTTRVTQYSSHPSMPESSQIASGKSGKRNGSRFADLFATQTSMKTQLSSEKAAAKGATSAGAKGAFSAKASFGNVVNPNSNSTKQSELATKNGNSEEVDTAREKEVASAHHEIPRPAPTQEVNHDDLYENSMATPVYKEARDGKSGALNGTMNQDAVIVPAGEIADDCLQNDPKDTPAQDAKTTLTSKDAHDSHDYEVNASEQMPTEIAPVGQEAHDDPHDDSKDSKEAPEQNSEIVSATKEAQEDPQNLAEGREDQMLLTTSHEISHASQKSDSSLDSELDCPLSGTNPPSPARDRVQLLSAIEGVQDTTLDAIKEVNTEDTTENIARVDSSSKTAFALDNLPEGTDETSDTIEQTDEPIDAPEQRTQIMAKDKLQSKETASSNNEALQVDAKASERKPHATGGGIWILEATGFVPRTTPKKELDASTGVLPPQTTPPELEMGSGKTTPATASIELGPHAGTPQLHTALKEELRTDDESTTPQIALEGREAELDQPSSSPWRGLNFVKKPTNNPPVKSQGSKDGSLQPETPAPRFFAGEKPGLKSMDTAFGYITASASQGEYAPAVDQKFRDSEPRETLDSSGEPSLDPPLSDTTIPQKIADHASTLDVPKSEGLPTWHVLDAIEGTTSDTSKAEAASQRALELNGHGLSIAMASTAPPTQNAVPSVPAFAFSGSNEASSNGINPTLRGPGPNKSTRRHRQNRPPYIKTGGRSQGGAVQTPQTPRIRSGGLVTSRSPERESAPFTAPGFLEPPFSFGSQPQSATAVANPPQFSLAAPVPKAFSTTLLPQVQLQTGAGAKSTVIPLGLPQQIIPATLPPSPSSLESQTGSQSQPPTPVVNIPQSNPATPASQNDSTAQSLRMQPQTGTGIGPSDTSPRPHQEISSTTLPPSPSSQQAPTASSPRSQPSTPVVKIPRSPTTTQASHSDSGLKSPGQSAIEISAKEDATDKDAAKKDALKTDGAKNNTGKKKKPKGGLKTSKYAH